MTRQLLASLLTAGLCLMGQAAPAFAGSGPRSDITGGHLAIGVDPSAVCLDLGLTDNLTVGVDLRSMGTGSAWEGAGARATLRLLGASDGWNVAVGGRLSVPTSTVGYLTATQGDALPRVFGTYGAASGYLLFSLPITSWFVLRYPIGLTYYLAPGLNGGQTWTFGSGAWNPNDPYTTTIETPSAAYSFPNLQLLPEAAFKLWGLELTLFGTSIAGMRLTF